MTTPEERDWVRAHPDAKGRDRWLMRVGRGMFIATLEGPATRWKVEGIDPGGSHFQSPRWYTSFDHLQAAVAEMEGEL